MTITTHRSAPSQGHSSVPCAREVINLACQGHGFQTRELLQRIVSGEQQRIKQEQTLWRLGGAVLGTFLGLGDGFQITDLFLGMTMSTMASLSHEVMSQEQRQFLEGCHSLWMVGSNSPVELGARLGPARSRLLLFEPGWRSPVIFSHHQGVRGDSLVPLGFAHQLARGFHDHQSLAVLQRYFNSAEVQLLQHQLYPDAGAAIQLRRLQPITASQARQLDPHAAAFLGSTEPLLLETDDGQSVGYRLPIPVHSDF